MVLERVMCPFSLDFLDHFSNPPEILLMMRLNLFFLPSSNNFFDLLPVLPIPDYP